MSDIPQATLSMVLGRSARALASKTATTHYSSTCGGSSQMLFAVFAPTGQRVITAARCTLPVRRNSAASSCPLRTKAAYSDTLYRKTIWVGKPVRNRSTMACGRVLRPAAPWKSGVILGPLVAPPAAEGREWGAAVSC